MFYPKNCKNADCFYKTLTFQGILCSQHKKRRSSVFGRFFCHEEGFDGRMDARLTNFGADQNERGLWGRVPGIV